MTRKIVLLICFCLTTLYISQAQTYLQLGDDCFDKGDYNCAKEKYYAQKIFGSASGINVKIEQCDKCILTLTLADSLFSGEKDYKEAKSKYKELLSLNPKDPYAKRQLAVCNVFSPDIESIRNKINSMEPQMVFINGGTFIMGCINEEGIDCDKDKKMGHEVTVKSFYIDKYEVTQGLWKAVMDNNPSFFAKGDTYPVESVSWDNVQLFISKLNTLTGKNYRLPTEEEWEYAARGGEKSQGYIYSGSMELNSVCWYSGNSDNSINPVGTKQPNELGIYDMSGNVSELCSNWSDIYRSKDVVSPQGENRVLRGGGWRSNVGKCSTTDREFIHSTSRSINAGFRLALSF